MCGQPGHSVAVVDADAVECPGVAGAGESVLGGGRTEVAGAAHGGDHGGVVGAGRVAEERFSSEGIWESDLGLYDYFDGHEMGAVEITREQAEELEQAELGRCREKTGPPNA